jgi:Mrp family chromosome partitioning ATPase
MHSLPLKNENKYKEWDTILLIAKTNGIPYSLISKLNTQITQEISLPPSHKNTLSNPEKWAPFTYYNPMIRKITNLFKCNNIHITFRTNNTVNDMLKTRTNNTNTDVRSDIYQLHCHTCHHYYTGQIGRRLEQRYKEHIIYVTSNNPPVGLSTSLSPQQSRIRTHETQHVLTPLSL